MNYLGKRGEDFISILLEKSGIACKKMPGNFIDYDFECKLGRKKFTIEVKYDWLAQKTGNIAIEYRNTRQDKPSGISATTADLWVTLIEDGNNIVAWVCKTEDLKKLFFAGGREVNGGDNNSAMKLFKQEEIFAISVRVDDAVDEKDIVKRVKKLL